MKIAMILLVIYTEREASITHKAGDENKNIKASKFYTRKLIRKEVRFRGSGSRPRYLVVPQHADYEYTAHNKGRMNFTATAADCVRPPHGPHKQLIQPK